MYVVQRVSHYVIIFCKSCLTLQFRIDRVIFTLSVSPPVSFGFSNRQCLSDLSVFSTTRHRGEDKVSGHEWVSDWFKSLIRCYEIVIHSTVAAVYKDYIVPLHCIVLKQDYPHSPAENPAENPWGFSAGQWTVLWITIHNELFHFPILFFPEASISYNYVLVFMY